MHGDRDGKITLDRKSFTILASETRIAILKALDGCQKTVTELARELDMNKSTVYEHLTRLCDAALIKRLEERRRKASKPRPNQPPRRTGKRKWVYYALTWKGRKILHPERVTITIAITIALAAAVIIALLITLAYRGPGPAPYEPAPLADEHAPVVEDWSVPRFSRDVDMNGSNTVTFGARVYDPVVDARENVSAVDPATIHIAYGIGAGRDEASPSILDWQNLSATQLGERVRAEIPDRAALLDEHAGRYLYLEIAAADRAGNSVRAVRVVYIPTFSEPELVPTALAVARAEAAGYAQFSLELTISNHGARGAMGVRVVVFSADPDADGNGIIDPNFAPQRERFIVAEFTVDVAANGTAVASEVVDARNARMAGTELYVAVDPNGAVADQDRGNNVAAFDAIAFARYARGGEPAEDDGVSEASDEAESAAVCGLIWLVVAVGTAVMVVLVVRSIRRRRRVG